MYRRIFLLIITLSSLFFCYGQTTVIPDSLLNIQKAQSLVMQDPPLARRIIDALAREGKTPDYQLNWVRAQSYGIQHQQRMAVVYAKQVLASDSVLNNPKYYVNMCYNLIEALISIHEYNEAMHYCREMAAQIEKKTDAPDAKYKVFSTMANIQWRMGDQQKAVEQMEESIRLTQIRLENFEKQGKPLVQPLTVQIGNYHILSHWFDTMNKPEEALQTALKMYPLYQQLEPLKGNDVLQNIAEPRLQNYDYLISCTLATYYAQIGNMQEAHHWSARLVGNPMGERVENQQRLANYYTVSKQPEKAIATWLPLVSYIYDGDSINIFRLNAFWGLSAAYKAVGDFRLATAMVEKAFLLEDSLTLRQQKSDALEIATLQETHEMEKEVERQQMLVRQQRTYMVTLAGGVLLLITILSLVVFHLRTIRRKNRVMVKQIDDFIEQKDTLIRLQTEIDLLKQEKVAQEIDMNVTSVSVVESVGEEVTKDSDLLLLARIKETLQKDKLFLNPELSRDQLVKLTQINKNKMAQLFQQYEGTNFSGFINNLRLEYSLCLLKDQQNYTIQAVAIDSGFSNVRTYYRLFRDRFGMTPMEYRKEL